MINMDFNELIKSGTKEIVLSDDIISADECIELDIDSIVIDGNGHAIEGMLNITGRDITLKNLRLNGVQITNSGGLTLRNCEIAENRVEMNSIITNKSGRLDIAGCRLTYNRTAFASIIYNEEGNVTIDN